MSRDFWLDVCYRRRSSRNWIEWIWWEKIVPLTNTTVFQRRHRFGSISLSFFRSELLRHHVFFCCFHLRMENNLWRTGTYVCMKKTANADDLLKSHIYLHLLNLDCVPTWFHSKQCALFWIQTKQNLHTIHTLAVRCTICAVRSKQRWSTKMKKSGGKRSGRQSAPKNGVFHLIFSV